MKTARLVRFPPSHEVTLLGPHYRASALIDGQGYATGPCATASEAAIEMFLLIQAKNPFTRISINRLRELHNNSDSLLTPGSDRFRIFVMDSGGVPTPMETFDL